MATIVALKAGNWSDTTVWTGGVVPGANDYASTAFAITLDQDITVLGLRCSANVSFTASGSTTRTINLTAVDAFAYITPAINVLSITNTGTTTINTYFSAYGNHVLGFIACNSNGGITNINVLGGWLTGSGGNNIPIIVNGLNQTVNIAGIMSGGGSFYGLSLQGTNNIINYTGDATSTSNNTVNPSFLLAGTNCTFNYVGTLTTNLGSFINTSNTTLKVNINGIIYGGTTINNAIISSSTAVVTVSGQVINLNDINAIYAKYLRLKSTLDTQMTFQTEVLNTNKTIYSAPTSIGLPAITNVRTGVVYGDASQFTGTMTVPSPSDVRVNVPTDNTVGTASLTAEDLWNRLTSAITTSDSIGKLLKDNIDDTISSKATNAGVVTELNTSNVDVAVRLRNASTVAITGEQIEAQ